MKIDELELILNNYYDLYNVTDLKELENGWDNTNILFDINNVKFVLRRYNNTVSDDIYEELELIKILNKFEFPTYKIKRTNKNKLFIKHEGKICIIYNYIEGECLQNFLLKDEIIKLVNSLHVLTYGFNVRAKRNKFIGVEEKFLNFANYTSDSAGKLNDLKMIVTNWLENENQYIKNNENLLTKAWIHHDLNPNNFIYNVKGSLSIIDFDECYYGPVIIDLASLFHYWCLSEDGRTFNIDLAKNIVKKYSDLTSLSKIELELLPYYAIQFQLQDTILYLIREFEENKVLINLEDSYSYNGLKLLLELFKENKLVF